MAASHLTIGLKVDAWAAIVQEAGERKVLGSAGSPTDIAANLRRRMPAFILDAALCALPLLQQNPDSDLIYCSCNGDLSITTELLTDLFSGELLSPAKFSISVHNAPAGMIGLALARTGNHTAIAAGIDSLAAGLTEAYARIASGETENVVLILAEKQLPPIYLEFDEGGPSAYVALSLRADEKSGDAHRIQPKRAGAAALVSALDRGVRRVHFAAPSISSLAQ